MFTNGKFLRKWDKALVFRTIFIGEVLFGYVCMSDATIRNENIDNNTIFLDLDRTIIWIQFFIGVQQQQQSYLEEKTNVD